MTALVVGLGLFFAFGIDDYFTLEALKENRVALREWVTAHGVAAGLVYTAVYALAISIGVNSADPMAADGTRGISDVTPIRVASCANDSSPICCPNFTATTLIDLASARRSVSGPLKSFSKFLGE